MEETTLYIYGDIGYDWWDGVNNSAVNFLRRFREAEEKYDRINVRLNGYGGTIYDGKAIYNMINQSQREVHTYNDGSAYSMTGAIFFAVPKERRHTAKNATLMLHSVLQGGNLNAAGHRKLADELEIFDNGLVASIATATGRSEEQVKSDWFNGENHFFDVNTMTELGFVENVEDYKAENVPQDKENLKAVEEFYRAMNRAEMPGNKKKKKKQTNPIDMDIKKITDQLGMPENSTEEQVLAKLDELKKNGTTDKSGGETQPPKPPKTEEPSNPELTAMQAQVAKMQETIDRLSKEPETDPQDGDGGASDFPQEETPVASWEEKDDYFNTLASKAGVYNKPKTQ